MHCQVTLWDLLEVVAVMPRGKTLIKVPYVKRLNDTLTYRGIASEAVFTDPPVVAGFTRTVPYYSWWLSDLGNVYCESVSDFITFVLASYACRLLVAEWYESCGIVDTRDTCAVSRYFLLLRYTAVYRDIGDTGIVT